MARSRNIKPGFCQNEYLVELPVETRLLFALLPMFADREGRMEDRPKKIKMQVFPADAFDLEPMLQDLHDAGFIERYENNNIKCIQIVNFKKHQNPHVNEKPSELPEPDKHSTSTVQAPESHSSNPADSFNPLTDSLKEQGARTQEKTKKQRKPQKRGSRLPTDWKPSKKLLTWAMKERQDLDMKRVIDNFTDYWIAKTGTAATKLDWDATFRNWVRNERSNGTAQAGNRTRENPVQRRTREADEARARIIAG